MIFLTLPKPLYVAEHTLGTGFTVRDYGLLEAALARPPAMAFGKDAYPTMQVAAGQLDLVDEIAAVLQLATEPRS